MSTMSLAISGTSIRQDSNGRFCLNDLHKAAGGEKKYQPANWLRTQQTVDLVAFLESEERVNKPLEILQGGVLQGTFVVKELVYAYATWISAKFFLSVIRAYDSLVSKPAYALRDLPPTNLTPAMQRQVQKAIALLVKNQVGTTYSGLYGQIKDRFAVGSYKDVPLKKYGELCEFLNIEPIEGELVEPTALPYQPPKGMVLIAESELETLRKPQPAPINVHQIPNDSVVISRKDYDIFKKLDGIVSGIRFSLNY